MSEQVTSAATTSVDAIVASDFMPELIRWRNQALALKIPNLGSSTYLHPVAPWLTPNAAAWEAVGMRKPRIKPNYRRRVLRLPDLDHSKLQVLNSLRSPASR